MPPDLAPAIGSVEQVQTLERKLIDEWGFPALALMERAAVAVVRFIERHYPGAPVVVMAGTGNNGADGLAVARILVDRGHTVRVVTVGGSLGELATRQMAWLARRGIQSRNFSGSETFGADWVLVDAIFGVGLNRALKSNTTLAIDWINRGPWRAIVSIDVPSGMNADSGENMGACVRAHHTITLGLLKNGLLTDPALLRIGHLWLADIGFPPALSEQIAGRLNQPHPLPVPEPAAHKGTLGTVLVLAGSPTMTGAAVLTARAAARAGIGLVYLGVGAEQRDAVAMGLPESIVLPLPELDGSVGPEAVAVLEPQLKRCKAVVMGPGMGQSPRITELVQALLRAYDGPVVLDADALPRGDGVLPHREAPVILTPHAGELGRMANARADEVQRNRLQLALDVARRQRAIVVLKGARTIIARPDGTYAINATGSPLLATAGSGDVLAGLIGGLLGRGLEPFEAAGTAAWLHGRAADLARDSGMVSLLASDVIERIPALLGASTPRAAAGEEVRSIP
ncbi:MAG: NAD(P)H-hydrate dehydratase [Candidatus Sericytochromatia bacterium]|nr:NAD(P)H-hydrate dehydratase [Candidatus Sericytochromatia bacterium]